jgi:hypothetical protein
MKSGVNRGYFASRFDIDEATFIVSILKKSCSNRFVSKLIFMDETSGIFLLLLHEKKAITLTRIINFFIQQIKEKKE